MKEFKPIEELRLPVAVIRAPSVDAETGILKFRIESKVPYDELIPILKTLGLLAGEKMPIEIVLNNRQMALPHMPFAPVFEGALGAKEKGDNNAPDANQVV